MSKVVALIPARYAATRFPGKLMQLLGNKKPSRKELDAIRELLDKMDKK